MLGYTSVVLKLIPRISWIREATISFALCAFVVASAETQETEKPEKTAAGGEKEELEQAAPQQYHLAEGLLSRGHYRMAREEFEKFLAEAPDHRLAAKALYRVIECLRALEKNDEALEKIEEFRRRWPEHSLNERLWLHKGMLLSNSDQFKAAVKALRKAVESGNKDLAEPALFYIGECYKKQGTSEEAVSAYKKLASRSLKKKRQYRSYAVMAAARVYQQQDKLQKANEYYRKLVEGDPVPTELVKKALFRLAENRFFQEAYEDAIELFELFIVDYPESDLVPEAKKWRVWAYLSSGVAQKALKLAEKWQETYGKEHGDAPEVTYVRGAALMESEQYSKAAKAFEKLLRFDNLDTPPKNLHKLGYYNRTVCLFQTKAYNEISNLVPDFLEKYPDARQATELQFYLGKALAGEGDTEEALEPLKAVFESEDATEERVVAAGITLAECYAELEDYLSAAEIFAELGRMALVQKKATMFLNAGRHAEKAGKASEAIEHYSRILKDFPEKKKVVRKVVVKLLRLYTETGKYDEAINFLTDLVKSESLPRETRAEYLMLQGFLYYKKAKYGVAIERLKNALKLSNESGPITSEIRYFLSASLLKNGQQDRALEVFAELLGESEETRPEFQPELMFRLEQLYYRKQKIDVSKTICRLLLDDESRRVKHKARLRLAQLHIDSGRIEKASEVLQKIIPGQETVQKENQKYPFQKQAYALLGELALKKGEESRAAAAFERSLAGSGLDIRYAVRAQWGMAKILFREDKLKEALNFAVNAYVLADDPTYTPKAMLLAVKIFVEMDKLDQARTTWKELLDRYPVFAQKNEDADAVKKISDPAHSEESAN